MEPPRPIYRTINRRSLEMQTPDNPQHAVCHPAHLHSNRIAKFQVRDAVFCPVLWSPSVTRDPQPASTDSMKSFPVLAIFVALASLSLPACHSSHAEEHGQSHHEQHKLVVT